VVSVSDRLVALGRRPVFSAGGSTYCWDDVLAAASARGSLAAFRAESRIRAPHDLGEAPAPEAVSAAATRFRRERGLLSAEELAAWLAGWELTVDEWGAYLERSVVGGVGSEEESLDEAEFVDLVCSGFLEEQARRLAADVALADLAADDGERVPALERIEAAAAAARAGAASEASIEREIAKRQLEWTLLELETLELADRDAAREVALCVRHDGRAIADVAVECGVPLQHVNVYLADVDPSLERSLLAAQPGELIGPLDHDGAFVLFAVENRTRPTNTDPELRRRAESALVERAVKRALESRLEWHELDD
jgi:hypothetical protein